MASRRGPRERSRDLARKQSALTSTNGATEWIAGRFTAPVYVTGESEAPFRPEILTCIDGTHGLVLAIQAAPPGAPPGALVEVVATAMKRPMVGPPRRPARVRVADEASASAIADAFPDLPVVCAETPELVEFRAAMASMHQMPDVPAASEESSFLEGGRVSAATVAGLFRAAEQLYRAAPWEILLPEQAVALDVPELDVGGRCISLVGGGNRRDVGVLFVESLAEFELLATTPLSGDGPGVTVGTLNFVAQTELPPRMRRELKQHRWPVAGRRAVPLLGVHDSDGLARPLYERDYRIAAACAEGLARFITEHGAVFRSSAPPRAVGEYVVSDQAGPLTVRLTAPFPGSAWERGVSMDDGLPDLTDEMLADMLATLDDHPPPPPRRPLRRR